MIVPNRLCLPKSPCKSLHSKKSPVCRGIVDILGSFLFLDHDISAGGSFASSLQRWSNYFISLPKMTNEDTTPLPTILLRLKSTSCYHCFFNSDRSGPLKESRISLRIRICCFCQSLSPLQSIIEKQREREAKARATNEVIKLQRIVFLVFLAVFAAIK